MRCILAGICVGILLGSILSANAQTTKTITMRDACDPDSFNAAVGPGTCVAGSHGNTLFPDFIGELQSDHIAGAWRFNPVLNTTEGNFKLVRLDLTSGDHTTIENAGGETHTFTRVNKFAGGYVSPLTDCRAIPIRLQNVPKSYRMGRWCRGRRVTRTRL